MFAVIARETQEIILSHESRSAQIEFLFVPRSIWRQNGEADAPKSWNRFVSRFEKGPNEWILKHFAPLVS